MAQEWAKPFYNSKRWIKCRESYIAERISVDGGACEDACGNLGEEVHHTITLTESNITNPDIALNHEKLCYLCHNCHTARHSEGDIVPIRYEFDENGMVIPRPTPPL